MAGKTSATKHHPVAGSHRPRSSGARRIGDADPKAFIEVTLTLRGPRLPDAAQLARRPLSPAALRQKFGASRRDMDKVAQVVKAFGLKIEQTSLETRSLRVGGTVAAMEAAFHPRLGIYQSAQQGRFRDREHDYKVPPALKDIVTAVLGFGERRVAKRRANWGGARTRLFGPADFENLYQFPPGDGAGQEIAIAQLGGGYFGEDLAAYCKRFGRPVPKVKLVSVNLPILTRAQIERQPLKDRKDSYGDTKEVMMDLEIIAGLCPAASISVYFATFDQKGWIDLLDRVIRDRPAVLSVSWGATEDGADWTPAAIVAINERLHAAAALGITVCVASGDDGSCDEQTDKRAHVDFPASSPFVLAVGGTMIVDAIEKTWRQSPGKRFTKKNGQVGGCATGGGVSTIFPRPSWQDVRVKSVNRGAIDGRVVPDVAALAGAPWYAMVFRGKHIHSGGTSASAPLWAALIARCHALWPKAKRRRFLTPLLYQASSHGHPLGRMVCRDVTQGHNISKPKPGIGYEAGEGFDAVTGWGTPVGTSLLLALGTESSG